MLLFHTSRYLAAQKYPQECFEAYGKKGGELLEEEGNLLREYLVFRAKRGWAEFDSSSYMPEVMECLLCLYDFACDSELVKLAGMMLDLLIHAASGVASLVLTSITSNEPDSGQGDIEANIGTPATSFQLRAERLGNGTGRIYTIAYTIIDHAGNKSTSISTIRVPHNQ